MKSPPSPPHPPTHLPSGPSISPAITIYGSPWFSTFSSRSSEFSVFLFAKIRDENLGAERENFGTQWLSKWPSSPSLYPSHPLLFARFAPDRYRRHPWFRSRASPASGQKVPASRALVAASMVFDGTRANHSSQWCYAPPLDLPPSCSFLPYNFSCF